MPVKNVRGQDGHPELTFSRADAKVLDNLWDDIVSGRVVLPAGHASPPPPEPATGNVFCPTGPGGGIKPNCKVSELGGAGRADLREAGSRSDLAKATHKPSTKEKQDHAKATQATVAHAVGGWEVSDNAVADVMVGDGAKRHGVEVKTLLDSDNDRINMHRDAYERKAKWTSESPDHSFHTIATDDRDVFRGGENKAQYSGHKYYYKRGGGSFLLTSMHPVSSYEEARRLMDLPDDKLPPLARPSAAWKGTVAKAKRWKGKGVNVSEVARKAQQEAAQ